MPLITALLHTQNDFLRLGRCLEMLHPCDRIVVVDHGSRDGTTLIAREYGAKVIPAVRDNSPDRYLRIVSPGWVLCIEPQESLTEHLAAVLYEMKSSRVPAQPDISYAVTLREETSAGWIDLAEPQTRLVPSMWNRWSGKLPVHTPSSPLLEGELLRFAFP